MTPWDSGRTGTSVRTTREERTGTGEGLMGRDEVKERKERKGQEQKKAGSESPNHLSFTVTLTTAGGILCVSVALVTRSGGAKASVVRVMQPPH